MTEKNTALSVVNATPAAVHGLRIETMSDLSRFGEMLARSGYFKDARDAAQACVKVQCGMELGIPPVQAMTGIHIVEGKPTLSAGLIAALVKRSGRYDYRIVKHDDSECAIAFFLGKEQIGTSSFTVKDAEKAGLLRNATWTKYARNMLFARALSNGARWHCADIFGGPIYTPEELGVEVDGDGDPVTTHVIAPPDVAIVEVDSKAAASGCVSYRREIVAAGSWDEFLALCDKRAAWKSKLPAKWRAVADALEERAAAEHTAAEWVMPTEVVDGVAWVDKQATRTNSNASPEPPSQG